MHWLSMPLASLLVAAASCASVPANELLVDDSLEEQGVVPASVAYEVAAPSLPEVLGANSATKPALTEAHLVLGSQDPIYDHPHNVHHDGVQPDSYYTHPHSTHHQTVVADDAAYDHPHTLHHQGSHPDTLFDHPHSAHHTTAPPPDDDDHDDDEGLRGNRFTIKGGYFDLDDAEELDDGWIALASWCQYFSKLFAMEFEVGYFDADGEDGAVDTDVWGIPIMLNGRINLPIWVLDLYGGAGIGTIYFDAETDGAVIELEDDGFLFAGNTFLGASIGLGDALALGVEGKYFLTDDMDEFDEGLDAFALLLTLGFSR